MPAQEASFASSSQTLRRLAEYTKKDGDRESALQELFWRSDLGEFSDFVRDHLEKPSNAEQGDRCHSCLEADK